MPSSYCRRVSRTAARHEDEASTPNSPSGHHRSATNGRICWAQAMGENQLSVLPEGR